MNKALEALQLVHDNSTQHDWPDDIWNAIIDALKISTNDTAEPNWKEMYYDVLQKWKEAQITIEEYIVTNKALAKEIIEIRDQEPIGEVVEVENSDMKSYYYAHLNVTLPEGTPVYANPVDYSKELKNVEEDISNMLKSVAKLEKENLELYETCLNQAKTIRKYQEKYTENLD